MDDEEEQSVEERIERDAYAFAQLLYDIYNDKQRHDDGIDID